MRVENADDWRVEEPILHNGHPTANNAAWAHHVKNPKRRGVLKPGPPSPTEKVPANSLVAAREGVGSSIYARAGVKTAEFIYLKDHPNGRVGISQEIPGDLYHLEEALNPQLVPLDVYEEAKKARWQLATIAAVGILMDDCDMDNRRNIIFSAKEKQWYKIDHGATFGERRHESGVGDHRTLYGAENQPFHVHMTLAIRDAPKAFDDKIAFLSKMDIDSSFGTIPEMHASAAESAEMKKYLQKRQSIIHLLARSLKNHIPGIGNEIAYRPKEKNDWSDAPDFSHTGNPSKIEHGWVYYERKKGDEFRIREHVVRKMLGDKASASLEDSQLSIVRRGERLEGGAWGLIQKGIKNIVR